MVNMANMEHHMESALARFLQDTNLLLNSHAANKREKEFLFKIVSNKKIEFSSEDGENSLLQIFLLSVAFPASRLPMNINACTSTDCTFLPLCVYMLLPSPQTHKLLCRKRIFYRDKDFSPIRTMKSNKFELRDVFSYFLQRTMELRSTEDEEKEKKQILD